MLNVFRGLPPGTISPGERSTSTVLNGTGVAGQAADAAGALGTIGFNIVDVDVLRHRGRRAARRCCYGYYGEPAARRVAAHITGGAALVARRRPRLDEVVLVTGSDFTTIHDQPTPKGSADDQRTTTSTTAPTATSSTAPGETTTTSTRPDHDDHGDRLLHRRAARRRRLLTDPRLSRGSGRWSARSRQRSGAAKASRMASVWSRGRSPATVLSCTITRSWAGSMVITLPRIPTA